MKGHENSPRNLLISLELIVERRKYDLAFKLLCRRLDRFYHRQHTCHDDERRDKHSYYFSFVPHGVSLQYCQNNALAPGDSNHRLFHPAPTLSVSLVKRYLIQSPAVNQRLAMLSPDEPVSEKSWMHLRGFEPGGT